jgi:hypothetical protein
VTLGPPPYHPNCRCRIIIEAPHDLDAETIDREATRIRRDFEESDRPVVIPPGWKVIMPSGWNPNDRLISGTIVEVRKAFESDAITEGEEETTK